VTANALGFPGPLYPEEKKSGTFRILTVGDAFTSAEGVDTDQAWPRLLEKDLASRVSDRQIEVLNFGITGYGPNHYAAIVEKFTPTFHPDLIIIGFFANEYRDVLISNEEFRQAIGFYEPSYRSWSYFSRPWHLQQLIHMQVMEPLYELLSGYPAPHRYFLGNFSALERNRPEFETTGRQAVMERLEKIKNVTDKSGAKVMVLMIPAPVQICKADQLAYYPRNVDLTDTNKYDLDLPQRMTQEMSETLGLIYVDLRPVLSLTPESCPYQKRNMHWTVAGHQEVAAYLAELLATDQQFPIAKSGSLNP
jgi:hypothetical protein